MKTKRIKMGKGRPCPKCQVDMIRYVHPSDWKPKSGQAYYFAYWDMCLRCHHLQHYEEAKRYQDQQTRRLDAIKQQLRVRA